MKAEELQEPIDLDKAVAVARRTLELSRKPFVKTFPSKGDPYRSERIIVALAEENAQLRKELRTLQAASVIIFDEEEVNAALNALKPK